MFKFLNMNEVSEKLFQFSNLKYLVAIKEGMVATIPLTIIGSFFLIIAFPPIPQSWYETVEFFKWIASHRSVILIPFQASMGLLSIFAVYHIAFHLARLYDIDSTSAGTLSLVGFLITQNITDAFKDSESLGLVIPLNELGAAGLFVGILTAIICTEILRFFKTSGFVIKMPEGVPPGVVRSFEALLPMATIMILFGALHYGPYLFSENATYINAHAIIGKGFFWLNSLVDSLGGALLLVFLNSLFWALGIHGMVILAPIALPIWLKLLQENSAAYAAGETVSNVFVEPFYQWYVYIGGSGATIGLVFAGLIVARSSFLKSMCKAVLAPALFNINEPIMFGMPVVFNPILVIPFILTPMVLVIVSWISITIGLVPHSVILAPWTFPGPIGAFLAAGGSITAMLLCIINIVISVIIYLPFVIAFDRKLLQEEKSSTKE